MALQKTLNKNGFELKDCYIKVQEVLCNKENAKAFIEYKSNQDSTPAFVDTFNFTPSLDGDNFIKQAYLYLKSLPEFADAVDC